MARRSKGAFAEIAMRSDSQPELQSLRQDLPNERRVPSKWLFQNRFSGLIQRKAPGRGTIHARWDRWICKPSRQARRCRGGIRRCAARTPVLLYALAADLVAADRAPAAARGACAARQEPRRAGDTSRCPA